VILGADAEKWPRGAGSSNRGRIAGRPIVNGAARPVKPTAARARRGRA
jgi:hypothetical protein